MSKRSNCSIIFRPRQHEQVPAGLRREGGSFSDPTKSEQLGAARKAQTGLGQNRHLSRVEQPVVDLCRATKQTLENLCPATRNSNASPMSDAHSKDQPTARGIRFYVLAATGLLSLVLVLNAQAQYDPRSGAAASSGPMSPQLAHGERTEPGLQQSSSARYQICKGDVFDVSFPFTPEFNQTATVQPDGYIALTGIGTLEVAGKTVPELTELIRGSYAKILHDPIVNIVLKDFEKPYFIASGEVAKPGKYELRADTTLTEAVAIAGGFTENSKHSEVYLFRRVDNNWVELKKIDVKKMFKAVDLSEDLHLKPGDMVFVPQNRYSKLKRYIPSPGVGINANPY
jgi:polysaccharide export outer membrane protein